MYNFKNDYAEGAHPLILAKLAECNLDQQLGYGEDRYSGMAKELVRNQIDNRDAAIFFVSGGTQANILVISHFLRPHEAVISAKTGHIYVNETGAIEATGHRVITVEGEEGKVTTAHIEQVMRAHSLRPHVVKPKMVYISNSTELGSIYHNDELAELQQACRKHELLLFIDGARLGHALASTSNDVTLADIATYADIFYIGGTKNGALLGEAIIFRSPQLAEDFDYSLKQKGALLAKGRVLGIQFLVLFTDNLYLRLAHHANQMAAKIAQTITAAGYSFLTAPVSNQLFPILPKKLIEKLLTTYAFYVWSPADEAHDAIRMITSWATDENIVDQFCLDFQRFDQALKTEIVR